MLPFQPDDNTAPGHAMFPVIERTSDAVLRKPDIVFARDLRGAAQGRPSFGDV